MGNDNPTIHPTVDVTPPMSTEEKIDRIYHRLDDLFEQMLRIPQLEQVTRKLRRDLDELQERVEAITEPAPPLDGE